MNSSKQQAHLGHFQKANTAHILNILEHAQVAMWEWDMERDLNYINDMWANMIGYTADELNPVTFATFNALIHEDDRGLLADALAAKHADIAHEFVAVFRMQHKSGDWVWIKARGDFIEFEDNKPTRMAGIHLEVSELMGRVELERVLYEKLDGLMQGTQVAFYSIAPTPPFRLNYISPNLISEYGLSLDSNEESWQELLHPNDRDYVLAEFASWAKSSQSNDLSRTFRIRDVNGVYQWVEDRCHKSFENGVLAQIVGTAQNVQEFVEKDKLLDRIADVAPGMLYKFERTVDGVFRFPFANKRIVDIYGAQPNEVTEDASFVFARIHPEDLAFVSESINYSAEHLTDWDCEYRVVNNGETIWVRGHSTPEREPDGTLAWYGLIMDVTAAKNIEKQLREYQQQLERVQEIARLGHWRANLQTGDLYWSDIIYEIFGFDKETTIPSVTLFSSCIHPEDVESVRESERIAVETGVHDVEHRIIRPDGSIRWVHELADFSRTEDKGEYLTGTVRDITDRKELELELRQLSTTDSLTKIDNRRSFFMKSDATINGCRRRNEPVSLVAFDVDHFKSVNDTHGHAKGDEVLYKVAQAVKESLRAMDVFARTGGEEFAVLLGNTSAEPALLVAEKLRSAIAALEFKDAENNTFHVTASFGVAQQDENEPLDDLINRSDKAMYHAKQHGRNRASLAAPH
ncbi:MAG: PAS domain-containing protein [Idiomarina sp.]|nr:PAS domain-containing protein [Idiomarina sp.]